MLYVGLTGKRGLLALGKRQTSGAISRHCTAVPRHGMVKLPLVFLLFVPVALELFRGFLGRTQVEVCRLFIGTMMREPLSRLFGQVVSSLYHDSLRRKTFYLFFFLLLGSWIGAMPPSPSTSRARSAAS
jgi:hypothetical protein